MCGVVIVLLNINLRTCLEWLDSKDGTVHQMLSWNGEQIHWDLSLVRSPNDWEEESVCNLLAKLDAMEVKP